VTAEQPRRSPIARVGRAIVRLPVRLYRRIVGIDSETIAKRLDSQQHEMRWRLDTFQHELTYGQLEPTKELLDLTLRSLGRIETSVHEFTAAMPHELSTRTYSLLNLEKSHLGFAAQAGLWINHPIALEYTTEEVRWIFTNERVVEIPWVLQGLASLRPPARVLDIGPTESLVALQLASMGYEVTALDVRPYHYLHPNLQSVVASILDWKGDERLFDAVVLLSTLEHIGVGAYGQETDEGADRRSMERVRELLRPGGLLLFTSPFGRTRMTETQRIYSAEDVARLLQGFRVCGTALAQRQNMKTWTMEPIEFEKLQHVVVADDNERVVLIRAERE
jgi:2-polyprenyl-3-methyl-5-hydroxy-6-metoxy-1,4-benzoquinol methylase